MRSAVWISLVLLRAALGGPLWGVQDGAGLDPAEALLAKAAKQVAAGHYDKARHTYRQVTRKYPGTRAWAIAERRSQPSAFLGSVDLVRHGPSANRVDVILMGDGYTLEHMRAFDELAEDIPPIFERETTFREYYTYLNFVRASLVSAESGVDGFGREYDTALGGKTRATIVGHVDIDRELARSRMDELGEHDGLAIVFVKTGVAGTGGPASPSSAAAASGPPCTSGGTRSDGWGTSTPRTRTSGAFRPAASTSPSRTFPHRRPGLIGWRRRSPASASTRGGPGRCETYGDRRPAAAS